MADIDNNLEIREDMDSIELSYILVKLWQNRVLILKWLLASFVLGFLIAFSIPKEYTSTVQLAPESSASVSSLGNFGSLAALAGVKLNSTRMDGSFTPDLYPDIIASTPFITGLFPVNVSYIQRGEAVEMDLYTYVNEELKKPWWNTLKRLPGIIIGGVAKIFSSASVNPTGYENLDLSSLTFEQNKALQRIMSRITFKSDSDNGVMSISVDMQHPEVAVETAVAVMENLKQFVTEYRTGKAIEDLSFTQALYDEAKENYYASQQKYAKYVDGHQGMVLQSVRTEQERLKNEMELDYQLYNSMAQQLQLGKAKVQEQTPVFTVIQPAKKPLRPSRPSMVVIVMIFAVLGFSISAAWVLLGRDFVKEIKEKEAIE